MSPRLSIWVSAAEIVSAIAVVVTLLFLVFELRESTSVVRATAYERNIQPFIESRRMIALDENLPRLLLDSENYLSWNAEDKYRYRIWLQANFISYESAYFADDYGLLGDSESERFARNACATLVRAEPELREEIFNPLTNRYIDYLANIPDCAAIRSWFESRQNR